MERVERFTNPTVAIQVLPWNSSVSSMLGRIDENVMESLAQEVLGFEDGSLFNANALVACIHPSTSSLLLVGQVLLQHKDQVKMVLEEKGCTKMELLKVSTNSMDEVVIRCFFETNSKDGTSMSLETATPVEQQNTDNPRDDREEEDMEDVPLSEEDGDDVAQTIPSTKSEKKKQRRFHRLLLDEALQQPNQEEWSDARRKSYCLKEILPNCYYYRFNEPGETNKGTSTRNWSPEEKILFLKRVEEMKTIGTTKPCWGIFSMKIPGRVGYACQQYYKHLVKTGEIKDPNYVLLNNKWTFVGKKNQSIGAKRQKEQVKTEPSRKKKRRQ